MSQEEKEQALEKIENYFNEAKNKCGTLYKNLDESKTNNNIGNYEKYIEDYRNIIECLNKIKDESYALDNVYINKICFKTDEEIYETRRKNCDFIIGMAQRIRGCKQSFEKYNQQIESEKK